MNKTVYLLWLHDMVLGVFASRATAMRAARREMKTRWQGETFTGRGDSTERYRWHSQRVSRLEVEPFPVRQR